MKGCFPYLDDITIAGVNQSEHDINLKAFFEAASAAKITINESKTQLSQTEILILDYKIGFGYIKPDPDRVQPLFDLPLPQSTKELQRMIGLFAYYARWIPSYSEKVRPLIKSQSFPLTEEAILAIKTLKDTLASATLQPIDFFQPLTVETDASEFAIAATLNQDGRAVAFHSRTLSLSEQRHSAIEKEAYAILEALRKWRYLLIGRHFTLVTDQKSVSFMFDAKHSSKIKNEKTLRWRLERSSFSYTVLHRPGKQNTGPDTLSRVFVVTLVLIIYAICITLCVIQVLRV